MRAIRFLGVGGLATLTYWVVLLFLVNIRHLDPTLSSVTAYLCGIALSYAGHRLFTFRSKGAIHGELGRFLATYAICFCAGNLVFWLTSGVMKLDTWVAGALLTGCNVALSYAAAELWIFSEPQSVVKRTPTAPPSPPE